MNSVEIAFAGIEVLFVSIVATFAISVASLLSALPWPSRERVAAAGHRFVQAPRPRSHIDIRELLHQGSESLGARLRAAGMELELELSANPLPVLLDQSGMQEVFAQIVDLARSVMPTGSTLQVLARIDGKHAVVNFMDAPPAGIDEPRLGRRFDEVYARSLRRNNNDRDAAGRVALCGQIVGEHSGRVYAAPSPLGSLGITLRLPLAQQGSR